MGSGSQRAGLMQLDHGDSASYKHQQHAQNVAGARRFLSS